MRRLTFLLLLAGCAANDITAPRAATTPAHSAATVAGVYHLATVKGAPLPFVLAFATDTVGRPDTVVIRTSIVADTITLSADGTFAKQSYSTIEDGGRVTAAVVRSHGTFTESTGTVTLTFLQPSAHGDIPLMTQLAAIVGATMSIQYAGNVGETWAYHRD